MKNLLRASVAPPMRHEMQIRHLTICSYRFVPPRADTRRITISHRLAGLPCRMTWHSPHSFFVAQRSAMKNKLLRSFMKMQARSIAEP